jgi:predicted 3-demethylubiquinone-9 3-methyltransferase (glyoxalase superfamily)
MQKITPFLWFDSEAEEAAGFYVSIFKDAQILSVVRYGESGSEAAGRPAGRVMTVSFQLQGQEFMALNGGPAFTFTPAISLMVSCRRQAEVDDLWAKLSEGGEPGQCGWLKDRYGLSWQIVPNVLSELLRDADAAKAERVMKALIPMTKLDIEALKRAAAGP